MESIIFLAVGIVAFIASITLYLVKEDHFAKALVAYTKQITIQNERLSNRLNETINTMELNSLDHENLKIKLEEHWQEIKKIDYAISKPSSGIQLPSTINFTVVERRRVLKEDPALVNKVKKQMKELSQ